MSKVFSKYLGFSAFYSTVAAVLMLLSFWENALHLRMTALLFTIVSVWVFFSKEKKTQSMRNSFQDFYENFEGIMEAARTLYGQSEALKKIASGENASVESSSSAVTEISAMLAQTASGAQSLAGSSKKATLAAEETETLLGNLNHRMESIKNSSQNLEATLSQSLQDLQKVLEAMKQITDKTSVINDIVFQTKLLSFNASVEAARAGEAGKGFAVVAEEIGNLATMSGKASLEINQILSESVKNTSDLVDGIQQRLKSLVESVSSNLASAFQTSTQVFNKFKELSDVAKVTNEMSEGISNASVQQDAGVRDVSAALQALSSSSQNLATVAETAFKTSFSLANRSEELKVKFVKLTSNLGFAVNQKQKPFDFDSAIQAHIDWRMKLDKYLENPDGSLKPATVGVDNACALGKWIYGDGHSHAHSSENEYETLRKSHAEFHQTAAKIISLLDEGKSSEASKMMSINGPYSTISEKTVALIKRLRDKILSAKQVA